MEQKGNVQGKEVSPFSFLANSFESMLLPLYLFILFLDFTLAKEHFDLDGDNEVGIDEFAVVTYAEQGLTKAEIGSIVKEVDVNTNGILEKLELEKAKVALKEIATQRASEWMKENDEDKNRRLSLHEFITGIGKKVGLGNRDVHEVWHMSDSSKDGSLTLNELPTALYYLRTKTILEANKLLEKFDNDGNGRLSEDEAVILADVAFDVGMDEALDAFERVARNEVDIGSSLMQDLLEGLREAALDDIAERFREVDSDGDGKISFEEMRRRYRKKKNTLLKKLFHKVDVNRDSFLNGEEWVTLITEVSKLKKRKVKNGRVIHVHPTTNEEYEGAKREEEQIRRKRESKMGREEDEKGEIEGSGEEEHLKKESTQPTKKVDEEEEVKVRHWDGLIPIDDEPEIDIMNYKQIEVLDDI